ncbi:calcium permeable stress-gated cation channel [Nematocida major]|uniref:calcium permeable stress-gated cation channel n=1 Tax=Nematocida major TaxID=1912982 RepID=UPI0020084D03|nr:calcium permeable stress-gated cation channel [Nematocida major]KAH9386360.1 calcium permeable stress-gated cation channel [Nematocida major]
MPKKTTRNTMDLVSKPSLLEADNTIRLNLMVQLITAAVVLCVFLACRAKIPWLYSTNPMRCKKHPAAPYTGLFNWVVPVFTIKDMALLELIGFDAFLFIETLKLLGIVFLVLSLALMPLLGSYYFFFAKSEMKLQLIMRLSLLSMPYSPRYANCIVPCLAAWVITLIIVYFLFSFYRKYVILRQIHIRDRVFSKSTPSIKKSLDEMKSLSSTLECINICTKTVLICNLPHFINNKQDLQTYLNTLGLKEPIENAHIILDTKKLEMLVEKKKKKLLELEAELQKFFILLNRASIDTEFFSEHIDHYDSSLDLISNAIVWKKESAAGRARRKGATDALMEKALCGRFFEVLDRIYPGKAKFNISECMKQIKDLTDLIEVERKKSAHSTLSSTQALESLSEVAGCDENPELHDKYNLYEQTSIFVQASSVFNIRQAYTSLSKTIPLRTKSGFVTFKTSEQASILRMSLIGSGAFSCRALEAPPPDQIVWSTLTDSPMERALRKLAASIVTVVFVSVFILLVFFVSTLINIDAFYSIIRAINPELNVIAETPKFRKAFQGIVVPTVYSNFLSIAPAVLKVICTLEGSISYIEFQKSFGRKYSIFLFINGFLVLIFGTTIASLVYNRRQATIDIMGLVSTPVVSSSVFFFNLLIHKTFGELTMQLLDIGGLVSWCVTYVLGGVYTRRQEVQRFESHPANFGSMYPRVFLLFPMVLIYSIICPLFMLLGCLYFFGSFVVFKYLFIYSYVSDVESGGEHWPSLFMNIFGSLVFLQTITATYFASQKQYIALGLILPLVIITVSVWKSFSELIQKNCYYLPNNTLESKQSHTSIKKLFLSRKDQILNWTESSAVKKDTYFLYKEKVLANPDELPYIYKDFSFLPSIASIIVPNWFYTTLMYIRENGDDALFDLQGSQLWYS